MKTRSVLGLLLLTSSVGGMGVFRSTLSVHQMTVDLVSNARSLESGQSATLLADGRWLFVGGENGAGARPDASIWDPASNSSAIVGELRHARAWHTATLLPDGNVLVAGGFANGHVVGESELFDVDMHVFNPAPAMSIPRAFAAGTLLTDGQVLFTGGVDDAGRALDRAELWDSYSGIARPLSARLRAPRYQHESRLLPSGAVLLLRGFDERGRPIELDELYDPDRGAFEENKVVPPLEDLQIPALVDSIPRDGSRNAEPYGPIGLRFSEPLAIETANRSAVVLTGPEGVIAARVVPTEMGLLVFVTPDRPLSSSTSYGLTIAGLSTLAGEDVQDAQLHFTTRAAKRDGHSMGVPTGDLANNQLATEPLSTRSLQTEKVWMPSGDGDWRTKLPDSRWASLAPLQAPTGSTALAGQVLRLDGEPLRNIKISIGDVSVRTDSTGRFLVVPTSANPTVMLIDGGPRHGVFEVHVTLTEGETTVLPYTVWLPRIDKAHAIRIPHGVDREVVVTTPAIPGLEIRIPPGTTIRDHKGRISHQLSITPIPLDRPPFPLARDVSVPIYFTLQPGAAYVENAMGKGAQVIYPNRRHLGPGMRINFWHYDPDDRGWFIYGRGAVDNDAKQIAPDPGVGVYEFTGAMVADPDLGPPEGPKDCRSAGDPCILSSGLFVLTHTDLSVPDVIPLDLTRVYRQNDARGRAFGIGSTHPYDMFLVGSHQPWTYQEVILPNGARIHYDRVCTPGPCNCEEDPQSCAFSVGYFEHTGTPTRFYKSRIAWNVSEARWNLTFRDGTVYAFPESEAVRYDNPGCPNPLPSQAALVAIRDRFGNTVTIDRYPWVGFCARPGGNLLRLTSPNGRWIDFTYESATVPAGTPPMEDHIKTATDNTGRQVIYSYDDHNRLIDVQDPNGGHTTYAYEGASDRMAEMRDARQNATCTYPCAAPPTLTNVFQADGKLVSQSHADGATWNFAYTINEGRITQADVTEPGLALPNRTVTFNDDGYSVTDTRRAPEGTRTIQYERSPSTNPGSNLISAITEPADDEGTRTTAIEYSSMGEITAITRAAGTSDALQVRYSYEPTFQQLASVEDPLGHVTTFEYDSLDPKVPLSAVVDPTGRVTRVSFDSLGQLTSVDEPVFATDPNAPQYTTQFAYADGDLVAITDPLGGTTKMFLDTAGNTRSVRDPLGNSTRYNYDAAGNLTEITDTVGGRTLFSYDANGLLASLEDARQAATNHKATRYTYDAMDRLSLRTDPLDREESFDVYDPLGKLLRVTGPRGLVTEYSYDGFQRMRHARFGVTGPDTQESIATYTYDLANRLRGVESVSAAGAVSTTARTYDVLGRLITEETSEGAVSYTYQGHRRRTMTTPGQPTVCYDYDEADRLVGIRTGSCAAEPAVAITYNERGLRETVTLPNGVVGVYGYDAASRLTSIEYRKVDSTVLGNLTYQYDRAGHVIASGGTWARTGLPASVGSGLYDDANQQTAWGLATLSYDEAGNLETDGERTFVWDAQNRLVEINSDATTASFTYDALGRRTNRTVNGMATTFLYDGANRLTASTGGTTSLMLEGDALDEHFAEVREDSVTSFLRDRLGSTIALTNESGVLTAQYQYEPYGAATQVDGAAQTDLLFTGREADGSGLFQYRARYYDAIRGRFVSADPLGVFEDAPNPFIYVNANPLGATDPTGALPFVDCAKWVNEYLAAKKKLEDRIRERAECPAERQDDNHQKSIDEAQRRVNNARRMLVNHCSKDVARLAALGLWAIMVTLDPPLILVPVP